MKSTTKILAWAAALALLGIIAVYALEFQWFENTLQVNGLLLKSLAVGLLAGVLSGWKLSRRTKDTESKMQIWVTCLFACVAFAPLVASLANRLLSPHPVEVKKVEFFEERAFYASRFGMPKGVKPAPTGYYIFFFDSGKLERLKSKSSKFSENKRGDYIDLPLKKGLFGYEVVLIK